MCYYVALGIKDGDQAMLQKLAPSDCRVAACQNESVARQMGGRVNVYDLLHDMCSCAFYQPRGLSRRQSVVDRLRRKYEKKGWAEAKIQRAIGDEAVRRRNEFIGLRPDIVRMITDIAQSGACVLFIAFYVKNSYYADIHISARRTVSTPSLDAWTPMPNELWKIVLRPEHP